VTKALGAAGILDHAVQRDELRDDKPGRRGIHAGALVTRYAGLEAPRIDPGRVEYLCGT
jgi:hypothetical protein